MEETSQNQQKQKQDKDCCKPHKHYGGVGNALYGLGIIGALVYYLQHATTFWMGLVGIGKAIFWPAVLLYKVLQMLHM